MRCSFRDEGADAGSGRKRRVVHLPRSRRSLVENVAGSHEPVGQNVHSGAGSASIADGRTSEYNSPSPGVKTCSSRRGPRAAGHRRRAESFLAPNHHVNRDPPPRCDPARSAAKLSKVSIVRCRRPAANMPSIDGRAMARTISTSAMTTASSSKVNARGRKLPHGGEVRGGRRPAQSASRGLTCRRNARLRGSASLPAVLSDAL